MVSHTSTHKGKRVQIKTRDGYTIIGKFNDKRSGKVIINVELVTDKAGEVGKINGIPMCIPINNIRVMSIYKQQPINQYGGSQ